MSVLIRAIDFANGQDCPHAGQFLESFDHDACNGHGYATFTDRVNHAKRFADHAEALAFWNKQSAVRPLRPDGRPNKPLTALTVEIVSLP